MEIKYVKDLMLPLNEYALVSQKATVYEAFMALDKAQENLPPGRQLHRAVLVIDEKKNVIGKLGHQGFLRALFPKYANQDPEGQIGLSKDYIVSSIENFGLWESKKVDIRKKMQSILVKDVMHSVSEEKIDLMATLDEAIYKIIMYNTLSILVSEKKNIVGILRLSDLFHEIKSRIQ